MLNAEQGQILVGLARETLAAHFGRTQYSAPLDTWLSEPGASFVTLTRRGQLRGCIGTLEPYRTLSEDVRHNALAAAFRDPRFEPLSVEELDSTRVEISLLSAPDPLTFHSEPHALSQLRPGADGVILEYRGQRATFLPQVWEQLEQAQEFMAHLKSKAGLRPDFWSAEIRLSRYSVQKWVEEE